MKTKSKWAAVVCAGLTLLFLGCAGRTYLNVDYRLPPATGALPGKTVCLQVRDARSDTQAFSRRAAAELKGFKDHYYLSWLAEGDRKLPVGGFDLPGLFRKAFEKRLTQMGAVVTAVPEAGVPVFEVVLVDFYMDLAERKWVARVGYQAVVSRGGKMMVTETVSGSAERLRIVGRKGADAVAGEIFTDIINRVDVAKLFKQAGLI